MALNYIMHKYRILGKKGEGTFSEVLKCQNIKEGTYWACKKMKQTYESLEQVNNLREIQAMRRLSPHVNIVELYEVLFDKKSGQLVLICELMDMNMYEMIKDREIHLEDSRVKQYMYHLCRSIAHLHRNGIFHRDVKPENILVKDEKLLKLADFGSCRSIHSKQPYTEYISTRWYRAPECLLTDGYYSYKMDVWSVGCVFFEIMSLRPLFPGANEVDQIAKIHDVIGTPEPNVLKKLRNKARGINFNFPQKKGSGLEKLIPQASSDCTELIYQMCAYDPDERITAKQALRHSYFKDLRDDEKRKIIMDRAQRQQQQQQQGPQSESSQQNFTNPEDPPNVIKYPPISVDKPNSHREKGDPSLPDESSVKAQPENKVLNDVTNTVDTKSEKDQKNALAKDLNSKLMDSRSRKTPPGGRSGKLSPGSTSLTTVRYPASIIHNSYQYQRRERERRRRRQRQMPGRLAESGPSPHQQHLLPNVAGPPKPSSYQSTFQAGQSHYMGGRSSLPKVSPARATDRASYLPNLTQQAFVKPVKTKNITATKTIYGGYQLPSIDKRGAGY